MNRLIAAITGLHVLVHAIFGCCDHSLIASRAAVPCHCDHAHFGDHAQPALDCDLADQKSPSPAPHDCIHASCHWLSGDASPRTNDLDCFGAALLVALPPASMSLAPTAKFLPNGILGISIAPPLRLHLALGVLLI